MAFAAGNAISCASSSVLLLAKGVLKGMLVTKVKAGMGLLTMVCLSISVAGVLVAPPGPAQHPAKNAATNAALLRGAQDRVEPKAENRVPKDAFGEPLPPHAIARLGNNRFRVGEWISDFEVFSGGRQILAKGSTSVVLLDAVDGREIRRFEPPRGRQGNGNFRYLQVESMAVSKDGTLLAVGTGEHSKNRCPILIFDIASGEKRGELPGHEGKPEWGSANRTLVFATPTRLLSAGTDGTLRAWDLTTQKETSRFEMPEENYLVLLTVSPDGKEALGVGVENESVFWAIWDVATGKRVHWQDKLRHDAYVRFALSPDGKTLAISLGSTSVNRKRGANEVRLYSVSDRKELRRWKTHEGAFPNPGPIAFSPDGRAIVTGGADQKIRTWDVATGRELGTVIEPNTRVANIAFLDKATLITTGYQVVKFWDLATGRRKFDSVGSEAHLQAIAYSPDNRHVATGGGGGDATVRVWDTVAGKEIARLRAGDMYTCAVQPGWQADSVE
jgi:WD40 repeat protein